MHGGDHGENHVDSTRNPQVWWPE